MLWPKLILDAALFAVGVFLFSEIKQVGYFTPTPAASHIMDMHLQPDSTDTSFAL